MRLPEISVQRPVFATVIALLLVSFGVMAFLQLSTREYPDMSPAQVSIVTNYEGAASDVVETRITQPIEDEIGGIEGIRTIRSSSADGRSTITVEFELGRDIDAAANDVRDRVSRASRRLPEEAERPQVTKADSETTPLVYISVAGEGMSPMDITDYAERYIVDRFAVLPGVASVRVFGGAPRSMRIWLDRQKLSARQLAVSDVLAALRQENVELPAGRLDSQYMELPVRVERSYRSAMDFRRLVVRRGDDGHLVRLAEVARVEEGPSTRRRLFFSNGENSVSVGVVKQSDANTVEVLDKVQKEMRAIDNDLPDGMAVASSGDASAFIRAAINGVYTTIALTIALVSFVILLFLGTIRATLIPVVCIPVSLLGAVIALQAMGYSLNLITLLAMVLAVGLVVDDAIVVLENIFRRVEDGEPPLLAAAGGAQQVGFAVIATTAVLLAVFSPVVFLQDASSRLFVELAVTISVAVCISSVLALSLVPMLCSQVLRRKTSHSFLDRAVEAAMTRLRSGYETSLRYLLGHAWISLVAAVLAFVMLPLLFQQLKQEYVPVEDQDQIMAIINTQEGTNIESMRGIIEQLQPPLLELEKAGSLTRVLFVAPFRNSTSTSTAFSRISMVPWDQRDYSAFELRDQMAETWRDVPGIRVMTFVPAGLGQRGPNTPVQFVLQGPDYQTLAQWRDVVMDEARKSGLFGMLNSDLKETQQQVHLRIDTARAASLGVSARDVAETLQALMTEQEVTTYSVDQEEYPVIVQLQDNQRATPDDIGNVRVRSASGELIPLSNLLDADNVAGIAELQRYNRLRAVTINATLSGDVSLGDALAFLEQTVDDNLPTNAKVDYKGQSLDYKESSGDIYFAFGLALLVLFLVMAAQFESFVHPAVIMVTVPLALGGGLLGLFLTGQSFNLFSQIGLLMLIGIATKNGILLVEFINQVRDEGWDFGEAIVKASVLRLRPVLMTAVSTIVGTLPLVLMEGPGSMSRNVLGIVVLFGVSVATLFTLYLVPAIYSIVARGTGSPESIAREMRELAAERGEVPNAEAQKIS
ncbi:efflux RND transporter permease subunit [Congregibacter brevis]|uniref:Efflux RND transporter permease subunit n=1 Tax=Congregibacter brevis TaxID=3081201 RepID=A0ABZ0IDS1_9GAMM|nr:efflux RND transporter permease subunit [Congregibacter sp. IMCC45268]